MTMAGIYRKHFSKPLINVLLAFYQQDKPKVKQYNSMGYL
jgi:hypothetical protein